MDVAKTKLDLQKKKPLLSHEQLAMLGPFFLITYKLSLQSFVPKKGIFSKVTYLGLALQRAQLAILICRVPRYSLQK